MNKAKRENIAVLIFLVAVIVAIIVLMFAYNYYSKKTVTDVQVTTSVNYKYWEKAPEDIPNDIKESIQEAIDEDFEAKSIVIN